MLRAQNALRAAEEFEKANLRRVNPNSCSNCEHWDCSCQLHDPFDTANIAMCNLWICDNWEENSDGLYYPQGEDI